MTNQAELDYEKQFQEDLAKATALSLEQQALDDYRRNKKYGTGVGGYGFGNYERSHSISGSSHSAHEYGSSYYAQLRARHMAREGSLDSAITAQRRLSEVNQPGVSPTNNTNNNSERTHTTSTTKENDLISWAGSPTARTDENAEQPTFEKLIEDLQKLQTTNPQSALVPLGPTAALPMHHHPTVGYQPAAAAAYMNPAHYATVTSAAGMQMVPYQPPRPQEKVPLTNEELQKLYSMPPTRQPAQRVGYFYQPQYSAPIVPGSAAYMLPQYPTAQPAYGYQYATAVNYQPSSVQAIGNHSPHYLSTQSRSDSSAASVACYVANSASPTLSNSTSRTHVHVNQVSVANGSTLSYPNSSAASVRRQTPPAGSRLQQTQPQRPGNDLIDLSQEEDSRVSVLEAFDPLLNEGVSNIKTKT